MKGKPNKPATTAGINRWFGGTKANSTSIVTDFDVIKAGIIGVSRSSVEELASHMGISRKSMAEDILDVSVKTLERKKPNEKLDKKISSHTLEVARIMQHAFNVFESEDKVKHWINSPVKALNNHRPLELMDTLTGLNMITDVLIRIEEGVYS